MLQGPSCRAPPGFSKGECRALSAQMLAPAVEDTMLTCISRGGLAG